MNLETVNVAITIITLLIVPIIVSVVKEKLDKIRTETKLEISEQLKKTHSYILDNKDRIREVEYKIKEHTESSTEDKKEIIKLIKEIIKSINKSQS